MPIAPLVSVVIPTYNQPEMLVEAIESVLAQTYSNLEILIVDDGSTDNTRRRLARYVEDGRIIYLYQQNRRQAAARNRGIQASKGELIAFLDHDDLWLPQKLERQVPLFDRKSVALVYSGAVEVDGQDRFLWDKGSDKFRRGSIFDRLLRDHFITNSSVMVRRSVLESIGLFAEDLYGVDDIHLWLRICHDYEANFIPESLVRCRNHASNMKKDDSLHERRYRAMIDIYRRFGLDRTAPTEWRVLNAGFQFLLGYRVRAEQPATAIGCYFKAMRLMPRWIYLVAIIKGLIPGYYSVGTRLHQACMRKR